LIGRVTLNGATGFVGGNLLASLLEQGRLRRSTLGPDPYGMDRTFIARAPGVDLYTIGPLRRHCPYSESEPTMCERQEGIRMVTITPSHEDVAAAVALVDRLDLTPINRQLRHDDPATWTEQILAEVEIKYRRFLVLQP